MADKKVVQLHEPVRDVDRDLLAFVDQLRDGVLSGRVTAIAFVGLRPGGDMIQGWSGEAKRSDFVAAAFALATAMTLSELSEMSAEEKP